MSIKDAFSPKQMFNAGIRLVSLAAKLGLTLYMGRYVELSEMGVYGLVFGTVLVLSGALGIRIDYVVSREIVGTEPHDTLGTMRDQAVFLFLNYILLAAAMMALFYADITGIESRILIIIFVLSVVENLAQATQVNMTSLGRPILANFLFFIRSASWVVPVILLGMLSPTFRNVDVIFRCWILGVTLSLILIVWFWRHLPWAQIWKHPVRWNWIKKGVRDSFFIWLGTLGLSVGMYVDRFIVVKSLGLDKAGIVSFYFSFTFAILTLLHSGILAFAYPRLIKLHRDKNTKGYWRDVRQTAWQNAVFAIVIAIGVGVVVPFIGILFKRPELTDDIKTLWLMLVGICIRANAETLYYILFSRSQDKPVWLGNLLFLIPATGFNALLVPIFGIVGTGYSTIIAALFLLIWRGWFVFRSERPRLRLKKAKT